MLVRCAGGRSEPKSNPDLWIYTVFRTTEVAESRTDSPVKCFGPTLTKFSLQASHHPTPLREGNRKREARRKELPES